jgi:predicted nucleic acid-binding protein
VIRNVLLDTGPLVALLNRRDRHHQWATEQWAEIAPPLSTCESVLAEACFLLRDLDDGPGRVLEFVARGVLKVPFRVESEAGTIAGLLRRYASVPMSLADACLVWMVERDARARVFTLDDDFRIYRIHGRRMIPLLAPSRP